MDVVKAAMIEGINAYCVHDAGRTQVPRGSMTAIAVGPGELHSAAAATGAAAAAAATAADVAASLHACAAAPASLVDNVTGHLKLL
ncbi:hypothetical protein Efla_004955 [Eimeria flavescens]